VPLTISRMSKSQSKYLGQNIHKESLRQSKENVILEQAQEIIRLHQELLWAEELCQNLLNEVKHTPTKTASENSFCMSVKLYFS
jgi:hypothetical protein